MGYKKNIKILLTGGGTAGPVTPLLALVESIRNNPELNKNIQFLWIGTEKGIEIEMVKNENLEFKSIKSGKLRRYFSFKNLVDPLYIIIGIIESFFIIKKWKPCIVVTAGGFVSVPVVWAAWLMRVPVLIHQQDARPGLANKLMAPFARVITVTFEKSLKDYGKKAVWTGNPARSSIMDYKLDRRVVLQKLGLHDRLPVTLVLGGGTGAEAVNNLVKESLDELTKFTQVIHICGKGKEIKTEINIKNYRQFDFLYIKGMAKVFMAAQIVLSRAGMGVLTELSYLRKPAILIPIPDSHQEENAQIFKDNEAALVLDQNKLDKEKFIKNIKNLLQSSELRSAYSKNISGILKRGANEKIINIIWKVAT